jgi:hypothetical protein
MAVSPADATPGPVLNVPATMPPDFTYTLTGSGFPANDYIQLTMTDSHGIQEEFGTETPTDSSGKLSVLNDGLPQGIYAGPVTVRAVQVSDSAVLATATTTVPGITLAPLTSYAVSNYGYGVDVDNVDAGGFRLTVDGSIPVPVLHSYPDGSGGIGVGFLTPALSTGVHSLTVEDIAQPPGTQVSSAATTSFTVTAPWVEVFEVDPADNVVNTFPFGFPNNDPLEIGYYDSSSTFHSLVSTTSYAEGGASDVVPLNEFPAGPTATLTYLDTANQQTISTTISHTGVLKPDLLATSADGRLWRYLNNGTSTPYFAPQIIGSGGWQNFNRTFAGDVNGDGLTDMLATTSDGRLFYYPNNGTAMPYSAPQIIGAGGWQNFNHITIGDVDGDGRADLLATTADGRLFYYHNNGSATPYVTPQVIGTSGWQNFSQIMLGDFDGDGRADLIGIVADGRLFYYYNTPPNLGPSTTPFPTPQYIGGGWQNFTHIALSDANGDGAVDILATSGARLFYYPSRHGYLAAIVSPTIIGSAGWQNFNRLI